jgi:hypothetical protein
MTEVEKPFQLTVVLEDGSKYRKAFATVEEMETWKKWLKHEAEAISPEIKVHDEQ